jgi:diguanylate cyclase (GGDEF)-like protein/PAS domain S-box-containing protein
MSANLQEHAFDSFALDRLNWQTSKLAELVHQIAELERERATLLATNQRLSGEVEQYRHSKAEWDWFFDHSLDMLCVTGLDGYFKQVNNTLVRTLGHSRESLLSRPFIDFVHPDDVDITCAALKELGRGKDCVRFENRYQHKNGSWRWLSWACPALTPSDGYMYSIARDVTDNKLDESELLFRAQHDPLTKLANRATFDQTLTQAMGRVERNRANQIALFLVDLDDFKDINDKHGHQAGDELLKALAARYMECQRKNDLICRIGGDEFAWIVEGAAPLEVEAIAERIIKLTRKLVDVEGVAIQVSCSIGIAIYPQTAKSGNGLLEQADAAMYAVKRTGKNKYLRYDPKAY